MALTSDEIEAFGRSLALARAAGDVTSDIDLRRISGAEEAEAVQASAIRQLGAVPVGYAVRAMTPLCARLLGCDAPLVVPLLQETILEDGEHCRLPRGVLGVGAGFTFVMGRAFPFSDEEPLTAENAASACIACHLDLHILGRRVPHVTPLNPWTASADFGLDVAHVHGPRLVDWSASVLLRTPLILEIDGRTLSSGDGNAIPGGPLAAVASLALTLAERGLNLDAGDLVATGSIVGLVQVQPGQRVQADLAGIGHVSLALD
ncbi:2-keto-4-pentenoate hydratase [uncultured Methylobacterium sp.]|uniref:2-keto-4-pentenoate hydratase n=1 Tax=uncultured Methylobacterium sp. TaxID=157278 RepID=UPI0035CA0EF3